MFKDSKFGLLLALTFVFLAIVHAEAESLTDRAKLYKHLNQATPLVESGLRKYLVSNCTNARSRRLDPMPPRHAQLCLLLDLLDARDKVQLQIDDLVAHRKIFAGEGFGEYEIRTGSFGVNPRLDENDRQNLFQLLMKKMLLVPLLQKTYMNTLVFLDEGGTNGAPSEITHNAIAAQTVRDLADIPVLQTVALAAQSESIARDLSRLLSKSSVLILKVTSVLEHYNSVVWPEYEAFKPILNADKVMRNLKSADAELLKSFILDDQDLDATRNYELALSNYTRIPIQITDEDLIGLYMASLLSFDIRELLANKVIPTATDGDFENEFMNEVQIDLLQRLNTVTASLQRIENEIAQ